MNARTVGLALVAVLLLVVGGGAVAWTVFLRGDNVAPLALPGASSPPAAAARAAATASAGAPSSARHHSRPRGSAPIDAASIPGTWTIAADSVVGYRVRERLASLSADSDAVGRTNGITGTATIASSGGALSLTDGRVHRRHDLTRE